MNDIHLRKATCDDLDAIKRLYAQCANELGFVLRPALVRSLELQEVIIATRDELLGAVHYHHRRDKQTTLYHIAVQAASRRQRVGHRLVEALRNECQRHQMTHILLKCPEELSANAFYASLGFELSRVEAGKRRRLNVWLDKL